MKYAVVVLAGMACAMATWADDLEPAVSTAGAAVAPPELRHPVTVAKAVAKPALKSKDRGAGKVVDHIDLDVTQITGNRELPNVTYIVPWKKTDLGDFAGRPPKSLLDELLAPVDRDVFRRQNRYFVALHPDTAKVLPTTPSALEPAITLPVQDEKARDEK